MALIRLRGDELCQDGETCAALYRRTGRRTALVRGYRVTDPEILAELAELNIPAHEGVAEVLNPHDVIQHRRAADAAWQHAQEFGPWWAAHPQHHHPSRVASQDR